MCRRRRIDDCVHTLLAIHDEAIQDLEESVDDVAETLEDIAESLRRIEERLKPKGTVTLAVIGPVEDRH